MITQHSAIFVLLALACSVSIAQSAGPKDLALKEITDTASNICTTIPIDGKDSSGKLSVSANAKLDGFVAKLLSRLTAIGFQAGVDYSTDSFKNVMHKDLADAIAKNDQCRQGVLKTLMAERLHVASPQPTQSVGAVNANGQGSNALGIVNGDVSIGGAATPKNPDK